ncbi:hypothetical protein HanPI659440_Chr02g0050551 [Helianthus annuus]|nr:hypothetical protein HanPI659440_Chr02g0050551 [Helianthus annuus]
MHEDPTSDLHPKKHSTRDHRISCEMTRVSNISPEVDITVVTESQPMNTTGIAVSDVFIQFLTNPKSTMFWPPTKTGEGSSNTPSDAEVLKAASLLEQVVKDHLGVDKPDQEKVHEPASSPDSEDLFGDIDVGVLMKRITSLKKDKIFKDVQIASLLEEITHKIQLIQDLETNLGSISIVVMDLKQKLEEKFGKEFTEPRKEYTAAEREQHDKEHEEALNKYIENPKHTANQKLKQKEVVMRNVGSEKDYGFQDLPDRYVATTRRDRYDRYGNRSGIKSSAYNDEKGMFLVTRKNGKVEYYNSTSLFESSTAVDLCELSLAPYHDQCRNPNCRIGWNFYNKIQKQALVNDVLQNTSIYLV